MKPIEDALSGAWIRPVVLSGIILTAGVHPLAQPYFASALGRYGLPAAAVLAFEVIFFGLVVSSGGTQIYYLYEGFILARLSTPARWLNQRRLKRMRTREKALQGKNARSQVEQDELDVLQERIRDYPLLVRDGVPTPEVTRPTLLANIIETYELYPSTRYGIDGVVFWYHLLTKAPDGMRAEFFEQYAFAQGLLLASFSSVLVALIYFVIACGLGIGAFFPDLVIGSIPLSWITVWISLGAATALSVLFYFLSLEAHRETGRAFRAVVDLSAVSVKKWLTTAPTARDTTTVEQSEKVRGYLRSLLESERQPPTH